MPEIEIRRAAGLAVQVSATEGVDAAGRKILYMDFCGGSDEYAGQPSLPDVMAGVAPISCNPGVSESSPEDRNT